MKSFALVLVVLFTLVGCKNTNQDSILITNDQNQSTTQEDTTSSQDDNASQEEQTTSSTQTTTSSSDETTPSSSASTTSKDGEQKCSDTPTTQIEGSSSSINDSEDFSYSVVKTSQKLLDLSNSMVNGNSLINQDYVDAMLQLSKDIGDMANRIGQMADKILIMSDKIGFMADRIVVTQQIQNNNVELTQANILEAQKNLETLKK